MSKEVIKTSQEPEILYEVPVDQQGTFEVVTRYVKDHHPELKNAELTMGWQGKETVQKDLTVVRPLQIFNVVEHQDAKKESQEKEQVTPVSAVR